MEFHSWFVDKKVTGINVSLDLTIREYALLCNDILGQNPLQRRRVGAKGRVYELLRKDLLNGCVMPPIVLAITESHSQEVSQEISTSVEMNEIADDHKITLSKFVERAIGRKQIIILDGLQRSYTIRQSIDDAKEQGSEDDFLDTRIRAEVYLGLNKMGILYRMLTLNTGQTPMSFRHQIEILYHDFITNESLPDDIRVTKEVDDVRARGIGNYKYQDVVDMLYAFSTGTPKSLDKQALVTELKEIDFLEGYRPGQEDLTSLLTVYNRLITRIDNQSSNWRLQRNEDGYAENDNEPSDTSSVERPFGTSVPSIFGKVQAMTGFGAEVNRLISIEKIKVISDLQPIIDECDFIDENADLALRGLVLILDEIASSAKRIGDAQRLYFQLCFRQILNDEADSYKDLSNCWLNAQETYNILY